MTGGRVALVVAVDRYDNPSLQELAAPAADAEALREVLGDPNLGGFDVEVAHNCPSGVIYEKVDALLAGRRSRDLALIHFSCHGLKNDYGELYLAATNTTPELLASTGVEASWLNREVHRSRAQQVVLLLDCCYGGAFARGVMARTGGRVDLGDQFAPPAGLGEGRGRVVITASTAMEYAFEGSHLASGRVGPSVFTGALVEGIRTGDADRDGDGAVSHSELYDYVYDTVREVSSRQTPGKWEFGVHGSLFIARNPHPRILPGPAPQPPPAPTDRSFHAVPADEYAQRRTPTLPTSNAGAKADRRRGLTVRSLVIAAAAVLLTLGTVAILITTARSPKTPHQIGTPLTGHTGPVTRMAFSPDGKILAIGSSDDTVRLWDVAGRRALGAPLTGHTGPVTGVAFSPDGKILATGSYDRTVRLWDVSR